MLKLLALLIPAFLLIGWLSYRPTPDQEHETSAQSEPRSSILLPEISFSTIEEARTSSLPTYRSALLDLLLQIDPLAAEDLAQEILSTPTTPAEWAVSLRNLARTKNDLPFLKTKTLELLHNPTWQAEPNAAYLEAFDLLLHTEATDATPLLSALIQKDDRKDLRHAAFLTLDRLATQNAADIMTRLSSDSSLEKTYPAMIAQQMARADLRNKEQAVQLKRWIMDPSRPQAQIDAFLAAFPNANQMFSPRLVTKQQNYKAMPMNVARAQREMVQKWIAERPR